MINIIVNKNEKHHIIAAKIIGPDHKMKKVTINPSLTCMTVISEKFANLFSFLELLVIQEQSVCSFQIHTLAETAGDSKRA